MNKDLLPITEKIFSINCIQYRLSICISKTKGGYIQHIEKILKI